MKTSKGPQVLLMNSHFLVRNTEGSRQLIDEISARSSEPTHF